MILNIAALVFVLGITFMQSLFGLYSGIINVFCSLAALAVAFGYAELLNDLLTGTFHLHPAYTEPLALALLFAVTLLILRVLADNFLRGNVRVPMYLDWAGGAVCGFINAQICVGVMVLAFLMLPWGGRVIMFSRYQRDPDNKTYAEALDVAPELRKQDERVAFTRNRLWLRSDAMAAGLFSLLSGGSLKGPTEFASVYPDFPEWVFWSGNTVQRESLTAPLRDDQGDGFTSGLRVERWWEQTGKLPPDITRYRRQRPDRSNPTPPYQPLEYKPRNPAQPLIGLRLVLTRASADRDKQSAYHRFRPSMIRLVGDVKLPDGSLEPREYVPQILGGADPNLGTNLRIVELDDNLGLPAGGDTRLDAYFEVDEGFEPRFVEYRRHARAPVTPAALAKTPPSDRLAAAPAEGQAGPDRASGPARWIDTVNREFSGDTDRLPFAMRLDRLQPILDVTLDGRLFVSGRLTGDRSALEVSGRETDTSVSRFKVPEGKRIFQLQTKPRQAKSLPGEVMNFVGSVTNQYYAVDDAGDSHPLVGYYAIVKKGGQDYVELVFLPDDPSFRGMLDFRDGGVRNDLQDQEDAVLGLIFLVPPGRGVVAVRSQGGRIDFGETFRMRSE
jgi:hypothetical protein